LIGAVPQIVTRWHHNITLTLTVNLSLKLKLTLALTLTLTIIYTVKDNTKQSSS